VTTQYPDEFLRLINSVQEKRPKTVIDHILKHGFITTQELKDTYSYNHPPRAIRDVREHGIPIATYRTQGVDGRSVAAYKFGDLAMTDPLSKKTGRTRLSKVLKNKLIARHGSRCFIYLEPLGAAVLQIDHRIPYEIAGDQDENDIDAFMLLSPSANRAKSWECEHCANWELKDIGMCLGCFWAFPESYEHVAGRREKVVSVVFADDEMEDYSRLESLAGDAGTQAKIKEIVHYYLDTNST
jgi:hypothetical protein